MICLESIILKVTHASVSCKRKKTSCMLIHKVKNYNLETNMLCIQCRNVDWPITRSEVKPWSQGWLISAGAYPGFCSMKRLEVFLLTLDGLLVHRRSLPRNFVRFPQQIAGTHLYTWVERGTVKVKCLAQEHNTLSPARARSGVERTNHEATAHN